MKPHRIPTPRSKLYGFWRAALAGKNPQITHEAQCGFFRRKLVKDGPWVGVVIWVEQDTDEIGELIAPEVMRCEVNGRMRDPEDEWTYVADKPISEERYRFMVADASWAKRNAPDDPAANPHTRVDLISTPIPF